MLEAVQKVLLEHELNPVLIDIGATGGPPAAWKPIAEFATYVGFEPDSRGMEVSSPGQGRFKKEVVIDAAVVADLSNGERVGLHLARSPQCSSTLRLDLNLVREYLNCELFEVVGEAEVKATTLTEVANQLSLHSLDWLKIDAQGTDLRILKSIGPKLRSTVLCVDVEPGLVDFTQGEEDSFTDIHVELSGSGFWLSDLEIGEMPKVRDSTVQRLLASEKGFDKAILAKTLKGSPLFTNARYLRTLSWCRRNNYTKREYLLLWVVAVLVNQLGFALDIADEYSSLFGSDAASKILWETPIAKMRQRRTVSTAISSRWSPLPGRLKSFLERRVKLQ